MSDRARTPSDIYPGLSYKNAPAAIEWLCRAFGLEKRLVVPGPGEGIVLHSELSLGSGVIMVSSAEPEMGRLSPRRFPGVNQLLAVQVDDPDAHYDRAKATGAEIVQELTDKDYGSRRYMARGERH